MMMKSIRKKRRDEIIPRCSDETQIEREIMKYLDIIIDDGLRFKNHCDFMLKEIIGIKK